VGDAGPDVTKNAEKARAALENDGGRRLDDSDNVEGEELTVLVGLA
jgi:hypothetical protein